MKWRINGNSLPTILLGIDENFAKLTEKNIVQGIFQVIQDNATWQFWIKWLFIAALSRMWGVPCLTIY